MARFVVFAFGDGSPVAVNPEHVTDVTPRMGRPDRTDLVLVNSDRNDEQTVLTVRGGFETVVARLNGDEPTREELLAACRVLVAESISDQIYDVRSRAPREDPDYRGDSWDHPRVKAFSDACQVIELFVRANKPTVEAEP